MSASRQKYICYFTDIINDGYGDLGHLINIANPERLKVLSSILPITISMEVDSSKETYKPIYMIACEDKSSTIQFVVDSLIANKILKKLPNSTSVSSDIKEYVKQLITQDNNVHIIFYDFSKIAQKAHDDANTKFEQSLLALQDDNINFFPRIKLNRLEIEKNNIKNELEKLITSYVNNNLVLQQQLKDCYAIEWISTKKYSLRAFNSLPALQVLFAEHGFAITDTPAVRGMGFSSHQHGVFLTSAECLSLDDKAGKLIQIEDRHYLKNMMCVVDDDLITRESAKQFLKNTLFIPGYFQHQNANVIFIQSLALSTIAKQYQHMLFHVNGKNFDENMLQLDLLEQSGFGEIEICHPNREPKVLKLSKDGNDRRLRIFCGYWLSENDYSKLYQIAQLVGGCSGDISLEKTLSNALIPFYETRKWKKPFLDAFVSIARQYTDNANIISFLLTSLRLEKTMSNQERKEISEEIAGYITDDFIKDWASVIKDIHANHNYYNTLPKFILESIMFREIAEAINDNQYAEVAAWLKKGDMSYFSWMVMHCCDEKKYDLAAFIYFLYPVVENCSVANRALLEDTIIKNNFYSSLSNEFLSKPAKNKKMELVGSQTFANAILSNDYLAAMKLLNKARVDVVYRLFQRYVCLQQYDLAAFIYLHPDSVKDIHINEDVVDVLNFVKIKKYSEILKYLKITDHSQRPEGYYISKVIEQLLDAINFSKDYVENKAEDLEMEQITLVCNDKQLSNSEKLLRCLTVMKTLVESDEDAFSSCLMDVIQKSTTSYNLLKAYCDLPFKDMDEGRYQEYFQSLCTIASTINESLVVNKRSSLNS